MIYDLAKIICADFEAVRLFLDLAADGDGDANDNYGEGSLTAFQFECIQVQ